MLPMNMARRATDPKDRGQGTVPGEIAGQEGAGVMGTTGREIREPKRKPAPASRGPVV